MNTTPTPIWITGCRRGIGRAMALAWAAKGHPIAGCATRQDDALAGALEQAGAPATCIAAADIRNLPDLVRWTAAATERVGPPAIVVHNAATLGPRAPLLEIEPADWQEVIETNTIATFHVLKSVARYAVADQPTLWIWLSSSVGAKGRAGWGPYAASKAAVENMHETFAEEIADTPWQSIVVNPGGTRTDMRAEAYPDEDPETLPGADTVAAAIVDIAATWKQGHRLNGQRFNVREYL